MILGFPVALGLTWFFEITPQGIKRTTASADGAPLKLQTTDFALAGALALVFAVSAAQLLWPRETAPAGADSGAKTETAAAETSKPEPPRLGDKSIAVLPFKNLSSDKDDAFFADGLTEETLNVLAQVGGLKVISRTSSEKFAGRSTALSEVATVLGVRYVLEGSVRRDREHVRVTAQLIDVPTDTHVWSKTFEPKLERVFEIQDDIARAIALALDLEIKVSAGPRGAPTQNVAAHRAWLQGLVIARSGGGVDELVAHHERATKLDPNFAEAYASAAVAYTARAVASPVHRKDALALAKRAVATATELKPSLRVVQFARGNIGFFELRWRDAEQGFSSVLDFDPLHSLGCLGLAAVRWRTGKFTEAERLLKEGQSLDPLNRNFQLSTALMAFDRADDENVDAMARLMTWAPKNVAAYGHILLAKIAQDKRDHLAAGKHFREFMRARETNRSVVEPVSSALRFPAKIPAAVQALRAEAATDPGFDIGLPLYLIDPTNAWIDELNARIARGETLSVAWSIGGVWRLVAQGEGNNPKVKQLMRNAGLVDYWRKHGWPDRCRAKGEDDFECS
jgi:TolB-like protein